MHTSLEGRDLKLLMSDDGFEGTPSILLYDFRRSHARWSRFTIIYKTNRPHHTSHNRNLQPTRDGYAHDSIQPSMSSSQPIQLRNPSAHRGRTTAEPLHNAFQYSTWIRPSPSHTPDDGVCML